MSSSGPLDWPSKLVLIAGGERRAGQRLPDLDLSVTGGERRAGRRLLDHGLSATGGGRSPVLFSNPGGGRELLYGRRYGVYVGFSALDAFPLPLPKWTPSVFLAYVDTCGFGVCVRGEVCVCGEGVCGCGEGVCGFGVLVGVYTRGGFWVLVCAYTHGEFLFLAWGLSRLSFESFFFWLQVVLHTVFIPLQLVEESPVFARRASRVFVHVTADCPLHMVHLLLGFLNNLSVVLN